MEYEVYGGQVTPFTHESQIKEKPKLGCYIQGLYLEGAGWSEETQMLRLQVLDQKWYMSGACLLNVVLLYTSETWVSEPDMTTNLFCTLA